MIDNETVFSDYRPLLEQRKFAKLVSISINPSRSFIVKVD